MEMSEEGGEETGLTALQAQEKEGMLALREEIARGCGRATRQSV